MIENEQCGICCAYPVCRSIWMGIIKNEWMIELSMEWMNEWMNEWIVIRWIVLSIDSLRNQLNSKLIDV